MQPSLKIIEQSHSNPTTFLGDIENWGNNETAFHIINTIFKNDDLKFVLKNTIESNKLQITSVYHLMDLLEKMFQSNLSTPENGFDADMVESLGDFIKYKNNFKNCVNLFDLNTKPNPKAVYWPNPKRDATQSIYETMPYVRNFELVDKTTPIGSAGSCFAFEIAYNLQRRKFNYVITEEKYQSDIGVFEQSDNPANPLYQSSANWGTLFNTPSFKQLAQKAFGVREFPHLIYDRADATGCFTDPYRENILFKSIDAYEKDYDQHCRAVRNALTQSEVFIITLGLNECWEYIGDDSTISRNPTNKALSALVRHRVLSLQENVANIQTFIDIVRAHNPNFKLIISVSPVPLMATARADEYHVITANGHSKAMLRVAAEEIVNTNDNVYYFPSYELVTLGTKEPWTQDQRHVSREAVDRVMKLFDLMFLKKDSEV